MTEFVGLDMEMTFFEHYHEVLDMLDRTFCAVFDGLNQSHQEELAAARFTRRCEQRLFTPSAVNRKSSPPCARSTPSATSATAIRASACATTRRWPPTGLGLGLGSKPNPNP